MPRARSRAGLEAPAGLMATSSQLRGRERALRERVVEASVPTDALATTRHPERLICNSLQHRTLGDTAKCRATSTEWRRTAQQAPTAPTHHADGRKSGEASGPRNDVIAIGMTASVDAARAAQGNSTERAVARASCTAMSGAIADDARQEVSARSIAMSLSRKDLGRVGLGVVDRCVDRDANAIVMTPSHGDAGRGCAPYCRARP